jgi:integrase
MIDTGLVCKALEPLWLSKTETASRIRGRTENVLDWAKVRGYRAGENPARWRGHLENLLPKRSKVQAVVHYRALPYALIPSFMGELRKIAGMTARCLEFVVLTAARSNEALTAKWSEVDLQAKMWTLPASKMKGGREHRVPLSPAAVTLLEALPRDGVRLHRTQGARSRIFIRCGDENAADSYAATDDDTRAPFCLSGLVCRADQLSCRNS